MKFKAFSGALLCLAMALGLVSLSHSIQADEPSSAKQAMAKPGPPSRGLPIAIYKDIKADDLNKLLVESFSESSFSQPAVRKVNEGLTEFEFSYPLDKEGRSGSVGFKFVVDGTVVDGRCMNCFLRTGQWQDAQAIDKLPWMAQYELNSRSQADLEKSYLSLKNKSLAYLERPSEFGYRQPGAGQRIRLAESNSYVGVRLPDLKRDVARALTDAGFVLVRDSNPAANAGDSGLVFSFPIGSGKTDGAVYTIRFTSQFDAEGRCYPCETTQVYDPYQNLPSGLLAMAGRLTLASRFETGFNSAHDQIKASTERYLRPGTQFVRPSKPLPPGSTRPNRPMVVT